MGQRQHGYDDFLARAQRIREERLELLRIRDEVAVRERRSLGKPRRAAGVLEKQQVIPVQLYGFEFEILASRESVGEADRASEAGIRRRAGYFARRPGAIAQRNA